MFIPLNFPQAELAIHSKRAPLFIDWSHPITQGLSWFMCGDGSTTDPNYSTGGFGPGFSLKSGAFFAQGKRGDGLSGTAAASGFTIDATAGYTFPITSNTPGTAAAFVSASFVPADGLAHVPFTFGNFTGTGISVSANKYLDNFWYIGWLNVAAADTRVAAISPGTFNAGDDFLVAATWDATNTTGWVKSASIGSVVTGATKTTNNGIGIGGSPSFGDNNSWSRSIGDTVYWVGYWARQLQSEELIYLNSNPFCFILNSNSLETALAGFQWQDLDLDKKFPTAHWRREVMAHD
jgi:hypothetical protein